MLENLNSVKEEISDGTNKNKVDLTNEGMRKLPNEFAFGKVFQNF